MPASRRRMRRRRTTGGAQHPRSDRGEGSRTRDAPRVRCRAAGVAAGRRAGRGRRRECARSLGGGPLALAATEMAYRVSERVAPSRSRSPRRPAGDAAVGGEIRDPATPTAGGSPWPIGSSGADPAGSTGAGRCSGISPSPPARPRAATIGCRTGPRWQPGRPRRPRRTDPRGRVGSASSWTLGSPAPAEVAWAPVETGCALRVGPGADLSGLPPSCSFAAASAPANPGSRS
jgi:hypothetical protein